MDAHDAPSEEPTPSDTPQGSADADATTAPTARLSSAALGAFGLVVLAVVVGCGSLIGSVTAGWNSWLGVMIAPVLALNGCVLAFISLKNIERRSEQLMGRPLALVSLFCGVGVTAIQGALVLFALVTLSASSTLAPTVSELVNYALADRDRLTRGLIAEQRSEQLTDADLDAFAGAIRSRLSGSASGSAGFRLIIDARQTIREAGSMEGYEPAPDRLPRPVHLTFGDQRVLAYIFIDPVALEQREIRIDDMLIFLGSGEAIVLAPDGPARELADAAGWITVQPTPDADQDRMLE